MELAQPVDWLNKRAVGYVTPRFSKENTGRLASLAAEVNVASDGALFCPPPHSLHITLLDWIAPLFDYGGEDKDELFAKVRPSYDQTLTSVLASFAPIIVRFDTVKATPNALIVIGHDDDEFQRIRDAFVSGVELLPGTKQPPTIIHSTLARFMKPIELKKVDEILAENALDFTQTIEEFRLVHTTNAVLDGAEVLKTYGLAA